MTAEGSSTALFPLVIDSWSKLTSIPEYQTIAGKILFRKIFAIAPGAHKMFWFGKLIDTPDDEMYENPDMILHYYMVIGNLDDAIRLVQAGDLDTLVTALKELGAKHHRYGVRDVHYPIVGEALLHTLQVALGDSFTPDVQKEWTDIYGVVSSTMLQGGPVDDKATKDVMEEATTNTPPKVEEHTEQAKCTTETNLIRPKKWYYSNPIPLPLLSPTKTRRTSKAKLSKTPNVILTSVRSLLCTPFWLDKDDNDRDLEPYDRC